jgi:uncharacterized protein YkwD
MMRRHSRSFLAAAATALVLLQFLSLTPLWNRFGTTPARAVAPGNAQFLRTWARTDRPVAEGETARTWMWGPEANSEVLLEPYLESPGGMRAVQYFDKTRMEMTHPDAPDDGVWYVTNGLLVMELVTGMLQVGDSSFIPYKPAQINVAGDSDDTGSPTYATVGGLRSHPPLADGQLITQRVTRAGEVSDDPALAIHGVTAAAHVSLPGIDHQVASPFLAFMQSEGIVSVDGAYLHDRLFLSEYYATGWPITEAYWSTVKVSGGRVDVLIQCFERRCLTFTPSNPTAWQVEAGNVGLHYQAWREAVTKEPDPVDDEPTATPENDDPTATNTVRPSATPTFTPPATYDPGPGGGNDRPTSTPRPGSTPTPTRTPTKGPTATYTPTAPPTSTSAPTATPTPTPTPTRTPTPAPTFTPSPTPTMAPSTGDPASCLNTQEVALLTAINEYRGSKGLPHLTVSGKLNRAAHQHSQHMAEYGYFSHDTDIRYPLPPGQVGVTYQDRIRENGYSATPVGENIAGGASGVYITGNEVFNLWRGQPGYDFNILDPSFKQIGIAHVQMVGGQLYKNLWTADFGAGNDPPASGCGQ